MNRVKSIWMMLMLLTVFTVAAFAQDTYYVRNDAQGDNLTAVKNNPLKPYKTIAAAINAAAAGDIISVACMTYDEAQVTINKAVTLVSTPDNGLTVATINNGFIINKDAATINLGTGSSAGFLLKNGAAGALNLTAGILNITTANVTLVDGANVYRSAGSITAAPTFAKLVNVYYTGESKTAGPELPVDCKGGILNNGMIAGKTLTVNATLSAQDIQNVNGNITFNAKVVTEEISNMGTGTLNFAANVDLYANGNSLDNAGTIKLNSGVMTIVTEKNGIIINNAGKIISTTSKVVGDGVITFVGTTAKANTIVGEVPSLVIPAAYKGTITAAGPVSIVGEFKLESPVVAAFNDNGQTIEVYEDFLRLDNTIGNYVADGTLVFKGAANQVFNSGLQLAFTNVTIDNAVGTVTLTQAANVKVKLEIKAKGKLDLNGFNLLFDVPASSFVNNGYQTTGNGLIIVNHAGTTVFSGTGSFSNLDLRGGATVQLGSDVKFAGTMTLRNGILDLAAHTATLVTAAYASVPKVVFYANKASIINGGDFVLDEGVKYDLVYALSSDAVANFGFASTQEWINTGINNLTVQSDSKDYNLTVLAPNEATSVYGNLMVNKGQTLILNNKDLTFAGASTNHVVSGTIAKTAGTEVLIVKANNITLKGDAGVSVVPGIKINLAADQTFTSTGLKVINGNITNVNGSNSIVLANTVDNSITGDVVNTAGTLVLNLNTDKAKASTHVGNITVTDGKLTYTRGTVAAQQNLTGNVQIDGGTLSLGSAVKVSGTTLQNDGTLELGANNYAMVGAYTRVKGAVTASTGKMVVAYGASANFTPGAEFTVPNLEIACGANTATLNGNSINVANSFVQTSGTFALGDNNMVVDGNVFTYTAGGVTAGAGIVELKGASTVVTMAGNLTLANLTINTAGSVTLVSDDETKDNPTARTLTLTGAYYQKAGNLALGRHSIQINGSFTRDAGSTSMGTGYFILNGGPIAQGDNWSVDNLKVITGVTMADKSFSVNKNLVLSAVLNAVKDDNLVIGDGALIERNAIATLLTKAPKFAGKVN
ncbi:MAG: beta strand repeat-containing protein, partial [Ignavibacteriales bacterium]